MKLKIFLLACLLALALISLISGEKQKKETEIPQGVSGAQNQSPIPPQFSDKTFFLSPIKQVKSSVSENLVTGITVPHHLLAKDLIAGAFNFASGGKYNQILVFSPDHFNLGDSNISTSERNFLTVFGELKTDVDAVKNLKQLGFVHEQSFFYREHGIEAELPFIKYYFPDAKIIVLTFKESTPKDQLQQTVEALKKVLDKNSLVVQSTDFSHYLTSDNAQIHDEQTIKVLESNEPDQLFTLNQPDNLDSTASQYVQMRLQKEFFSSDLLILNHKNSQDYTEEKIDSTTSYIVQAYLKK